MPLYVGTHSTDCVKVYRGIYPFCKIYQGSTLKWWAADCQACVKYGYLYNRFVVTDSRHVYSSGWHVPTDAEWTTLTDYLGTKSSDYDNPYGYKLKETGFVYWNSPNTDATNEVGFYGRGSGHRLYTNGTFELLQQQSYYWSSSVNYGDYYWARQLYYNQNLIHRGYADPENGMSIRLIKDDSTLVGYVGNDGKTYNTVKIGSQVWMAENLAETEFADHSKIPVVEGATTWTGLLTGGMCAYDNDYTNVGCGETEPELTEVEYGLLYNCYAATDARYIAPAGWHVPTWDEWITLSNYLGGGNHEGGSLKETGYTYWDSPNTGADNSTGFYGRGSGARVIGGVFLYLNKKMILASSTSSSSTWIIPQLNNGDDDFQIMSSGSEYYGAAIRLIKDDSTDTGTMVDNDGNIYPTVKIGDQVWMAKNLKTTKYRNGDAIPEVTDNSAWVALTTGALCAYDNDWDNV